ncbi:MAG: hypothetical protein IKM48_04260 [Clostridia bacterium]|nr:hypothetical protein [Clostridia bacterium]
METSLSYAEIFNLAGLLTNSGLTFKEARIPATEALIAYGLNVKGLGSCKYYNLDYAADMLNAFIFEDIAFEDYMEENGIDRTPWFYGELVEEEEEETEDEPLEEEELPDEEADGEEELPDPDPEDTTLPEDGTEDVPDGEQPDTETPDQPAETPDQSTDSEQTETPPEGDAVTDPAAPTV